MAHAWSDHEGTFALPQVVLAEPGTRRVLAVVSSQCYCCCLWRAPQLLNMSFPSPHLALLPVMFLLPCWAWNRRVTVLLRRTAHCPLTMERLQDFLTILQSKMESYLHSLS